MGIQKISFRVPSAAGEADRTAKISRLDQVLAENFFSVCRVNLSRGQARKLIVAGAVYLNRKRVRIASKEVRTGAHIEVYLDLAALKNSEMPPIIKKNDALLTPEAVLFEDAGLIALAKPAGLPTQPTLDDARANLFQALKDFLKKRDHLPEVYVGLHHRLDRDTSGVVLFTKDPALNAGVAELFKSHSLQKRYLAVVNVADGKLRAGQEWVVKNYLGIVGKKGKKKKFGAVQAGGDFAETRFRCIGVADGLALVQAMPRTGRTHQIRVHLSESGMPILGDVFYGGSGAYRGIRPRVLLHAEGLSFTHPQTKQNVALHCPPPEDFQAILAQAGLTMSIN